MDADEMKKITEKYGSENASKINEMRGRYRIDVKRLLKYMEDNNLDAKQVEDKILEYQVESGDGIGILSVPEDPVSYDKYLTAPYSYRGNAAENVNLNTGSLTYEITDLLLPGRNGLDLIIVSRYESDKANLYEADYRIESELIEYIDYDYEVWSGCNGYEVDPGGYYTLLDFPYTQSCYESQGRSVQMTRIMSAVIYQRRWQMNTTLQKKGYAF